MMYVDVVYWIPIVAGVVMFCFVQYVFLGMSALGGKGYKWWTTLIAAAYGGGVWLLLMLLLRGAASLIKG